MDYPKILLDTEWQKQKGIVAKMVGETGMGAACLKCRAVYDTVDWAKIYPVTVYKNEQALAEAKAACMTEGKKMETVRKGFFDLRDFAKKVQDKFKAHKLIPKSSAEHVGKMMAACEEAALYCKSVGGIVMPKFEEAGKRMLANRAIALKIVKDQIPKVRNCIAEVIKKPSVDLYNSNCWQPCRAFAAGVAKAPPLAQLQPEWKTLTSIVPGDLKDANGVKAHAQKLDALLTRTAVVVG